MELSQPGFDLKDTHSLHIEPAVCPGDAAMSTSFPGERHFKGEHFPQDTACGIPFVPSCLSNLVRQFPSGNKSAYKCKAVFR